MTIDNSRIYVGTIEREIATQGDIATTDISSELDSLDRVVLISFKTKNDEVKYVPFSYIANFHYLVAFRVVGVIPGKVAAPPFLLDEGPKVP